MKSAVPFPFFLLIALLTSCNTGKYALLNGDYEMAVYKAVDYLEKHPNDQRAISILDEAYSTFKGNRLSSIIKLERENAPFAHELIMEEYKWLQRISVYASKCQTCSTHVNVRNYRKEIERQRNLAFDERMQFGQEALEEARMGNKVEARKAVNHFLVVENLKPGINLTDNLLEEAVELSMITIAVRSFDSTIGLPEAYLTDLETQIIWHTQGRLNDTLMRFMSFNESLALNCHVDLVVNVEVTDLFSNGVTRTRQSHKRKVENVEVGQTKPKGKDSNGERLKPEPIYGTVKATFHEIRLSKSSRALATLTVYDRFSNQNAYFKELSVVQNWSTSRYKYNGDERALSSSDKGKLRQFEAIPTNRQLEREAMNMLSGVASAHLRAFLSTHFQ